MVVLMINFKNSQEIQKLLVEGYEMKASIDKLAIEAQDTLDFFIEHALDTDEKHLEHAKDNLLKVIVEQQEIHDLITRLKSYKTAF